MLRKRKYGSQRRLRHLRSVLCRGLRSPQPNCLLSTYFCLFRGNEPVPEALVFRSPVAKNTQNPTWHIELGEEKLQEYRQDTVFTLIIYDSESDQALLSSVIDLRCCVYCPEQELVTRNTTLPPILLQTDDGIFYPGTVESHEDEQEVTLKPEVTMTFADLRCNLLRMLGTTFSIQLVQSRTQESITAAETVLSQTRSIRERQAMIAACRHRIAILQEQIRGTTAQLQVDQQILNGTRDRLRDRRLALNEAQNFLAAKESNAQELHKEIAALGAAVGSTRKGVESRRLALTKPIGFVYPVHQSDREKTLMTIATMHPPIVQGQDERKLGQDEEAATALGYVCHVVQLLSRIWGVTLRYKLFPIYSRSYVQEDSIEVASQIHPLFYVRGSDKIRYFRAIMLLNRNVQQLLRLRGHTPRQYMLQNLRLLMSGEAIHAPQK
eukprot:TRINITY_DN7279_c0_g1_i1.p1 TRINITY_DN7279_c0_g1~~TRINITY_DN7279_c0_g1_i1.p1  ORF type:complete len:449 (+),score=74.94 TRINITY_DN7279_c0_g1_i1:34-1347(+)